MDIEPIKNKIKKHILEWNSKDMEMFFEIIDLNRVFEQEQINPFEKMNGETFIFLDLDEENRLKKFKNCILIKLKNWQKFLKKNYDITQIEKPILTISDLEKQGKRYTFNPDDKKFEFSIGRLKSNDYIVDNEKISSKHSIITYHDGNFILSDQNSSNGTYFKLETGCPYLIYKGLIIELGYNLFRVEDIESSKIKLLCIDGHTNLKENIINLNFSKVNSLFYGDNCTFDKIDIPSDDVLEKNHAIFFKKNGLFFIMALETNYGLWIQIGNKKYGNKNSIYLKSDDIFRIEDFQFKIEKCEGFPLEKCQLCSQAAKFKFILFCKHLLVCEKCNKNQLCPKCNEISSFNKN